VINLKKKIKTLREKVTNKKYYAASAELKKIKQTIPSFSNPSIESEISDHITSAERLVQEAKKSDNEATIVDRCSKAFLECSDHPEIINLLKKYPISPPTSLSVTTDTINCSITLNWQGSPLMAIFFIGSYEKKIPCPGLQMMVNSFRMKFPVILLIKKLNLVLIISIQFIQIGQEFSPNHYQQQRE
jgi:hypothetical protein